MATSDFLSGPAMPPAMSTLVADRLREMITRGVLAPGERLKETELADSMQVSRGPVREAISILERDGLIELQRHRGARVITLTYDDIEEVYSLRLAIERLAMERCAARITDETLAAMDDVIARMKALTGPNENGDHVALDHVSLDLEFHDLVYEAADHARLRRTWALLRSQVSMFLNARTDREDFRSSAWSEHAELRDVLAKGDPAAAAAAIEKHIGWTLRRIRQMRGTDAARVPGPLSGPGPEGKTGL
ncbi:GntR family transcriptional regulator [Glycomyces harbinensis]|uniref:DNA-binding transcriptional regulator, GntR family n=1 Tax=Glycomyces harbinensis TaxID=58114 RepID=A0A1G6QWA3_9ACTN|nr:GntR family transcriptional regulator [Glycomyces harbinensis]SDC96588.1 DNA-binding transcriptional regulator, GntR family [Glycomyces harbinensis]